MRPCMPFFRATVLLTVLLTLLTGCEQQQSVNFIPEDYRSWPRTTDTTLQFPIPGHEDNLRKIYINPEGLDYDRELVDGKLHYFFPEGTVIVKEVYDGFNPGPDEPPKQLTVMVKKPEHPKSLGGWLWIVAPSADGTEKIVENEFCMTCHSNANEEHPYDDENPNEQFRDYVFYLPKQD
ncbi:MAG: cytochrome P460 family protein [Spirochaetota bacterium]